MRATLTDVTLIGVNRTKGVLAFDLIYSGTLTITVALGALEVT
jgi:hypothetical protein